MRSNRASDECTSVETCSIDPIGKNSRDCRVVNATIVPAWIAVEPSEICQPATRYTSAGVMEKNVPTTAKNDRPIMVWRICRPVRRTFSSRKRAISCRCLPNDFESRMPLTDSVSSVIAVRSASVFWVLDETSRRARPTLTVSHRNSGNSASDSSVSGTDSTSIAIRVLMIVTTFESTFDAVSVTTDCTPPTSFESRDWISPVLVLVKNRKGMCCRCAYKALRRSCITCRPTWFAQNVCPMPITLVTTGTATIRPTYW